MLYEEFFEKFLAFESEKELYELEISNVSVWEFIRIPIFKTLRKKLVTESIRYTDKTRKGAISGLKEYLRNSFLTSKELVKKADILVFNHPRRKLEQGSYTDIYTDTFLPHIHYKYVVAERYFHMTHPKPVLTKNLIYLDFLEFPSRFVNLLPFQKIRSSNDIAKIRKLENDIYQFWGLPVNSLFYEVQKCIRRYIYVYPRMCKLIKKINPRIILVVVSYNFYAQIAIIAAKKLGVSTAEIQHGTVGNLHYGYNYPIGSQLKTFPDYFLAWGKYWVKNARLPIADSRIIEIGFPYIEKFRNNITRETKRPNQIVVISQLKDNIARFALELAGMLPEYNIVFKAHPTEYSYAHLSYPYLYEKKNITVVNNDDKSLYRLFAESCFVCGVSSTALIESLAFGSILIVIKFPGWEYFQNLNSTNGINFISSAEEAQEIVKNYRATDFSEKHDPNLFFKSNSIQNINDFFSSVLN